MNDGFAFCYACDDYILNDNNAGDLRLLREILSVVARQRFAPDARATRQSLRALQQTPDGEQPVCFSSREYRFTENS